MSVFLHSDLTVLINNNKIIEWCQSKGLLPTNQTCGEECKAIITKARDKQIGREGGTWLAMNRTNGKVGCLLNILQHQLLDDMKSRGHIVVDYLRGNHSPVPYLREICEEGSNYNRFLMFALQIKFNTRVEAAIFSNLYHSEPTPLSDGVHAFGNNEIDGHLWPKVSYGKKRFEQLVTQYSTTEFKQQLIDEIFHLFSDKTIHPLDSQMRNQGKAIPEKSLEKLNSIFVELPGYGSRTWSIILIDGSLNVDYIEKTIKEPIYSNGENNEWIITSKQFKLEIN